MKNKSKRKFSALPGAKRAWIISPANPSSYCFGKRSRSIVLIGHSKSKVRGLFKRNYLDLVGLLEDDLYDNGDDLGLVGYGEVIAYNPTKYYFTDTYICQKYRGQYLGDYLYKTLLLAAKRAARRNDISLKELKVGCHEAAGVFTSAPAWRCYQALHRKGYLSLPQKEIINKQQWFTIKKWPKHIKPRYHVVSNEE